MGISRALFQFIQFQGRKNFVRRTLGSIAIPSDVIFISQTPNKSAGRPVRQRPGRWAGQLQVASNPAFFLVFSKDINRKLPKYYYDLPAKARHPSI
jgi:hypothetical protein